VDPILHRTILSQNTEGSPDNTSLSQQSPFALIGRSDSRLKRFTLTDLARQMKERHPKHVIENKQLKDQTESESEGESSDSSSGNSDSDEESEEENGIPKAKLAGRAPVAKKKKSGSLRSMFK